MTLSPLFSITIALAMSVMLHSEPPSQAGTTPPATKSETASPVLLYDTLVDPSVLVEARETGASPLLLIYQYCSPDSKSSGNIDVAAVLMCIDRLTQGEPPAWGMLDIEYGFTDRMQQGVGGPGARHARDEMIRLMRAVRAAYPRTRWTYYGVPFLPYWLNHRSWLDATEEQKRAEMTRCAEMYGPIVAECDWVSPSIYAVYDPAMFKPPEQSGVRRAGVAWRTAQVGFARLLARGKPVIPTISPVWQPGGRTPSGGVVPPDQFVEDQVLPAMRAGAAGVAIWTAYVSMIDAATRTAEDTTRSGEFPRDNMARSLLDGAVPADWKSPELPARLRAGAAKVVLRALRDARAAQRSVAAPAPATTP